jgi:hypothetical protein
MNRYFVRIISENEDGKVIENEFEAETMFRGNYELFIRLSLRGVITHLIGILQRWRCWCDEY